MTAKHGKRGLVMGLVGCVLALVILLLGAVPGLAASENTQGVLDQLAYLQRVHIQPEWLPDITANQGAVQALLDGYLDLSLAERRELSAQNRTDLRAYFEALYQVQGKDVEGVDALFEDTTAAPGGSSSPASSSSSRAASSSAASSSTPSSSRASSAASGSGMEDSSAASVSGSESASASSSTVVAPAPVVPASDASGDSSSQGIPAAVEPPQSPGDEGWLALFGSRTLGTALLMILVVLAVLLFVRFLVALRRVQKDGATQAHVDARAQEMFGESYDPVEDPLNDDFIAPPPADFLDTAPATLSEEETPFDDEDDLAREKADFGMFAPDNAPDAVKKEGFFARRKREKDEQEAGEELEELQTEVLKREEVQKAEEKPAEQPSPFAPPGGSSRFDKAFGGRETAPGFPEPEELPKEEAPLPKEAEPLFAANPDRRNSITTRSFSAPPRTGRPAKMSFRQGDPDDLDAIDE